jgi:luciferase family oxidoreductase group 1
MGLPYAFASHFAPGQLLTALEIYRQNFRPSPTLAKPYVIACVNVIAADTDEHATYLSTSLQQFMLGVINGRPAPLQPPVESMAPLWGGGAQQHAVQQMLAYSFIGSAATVQQDLQEFIAQTQVDELMATSNIFDQEARVYSYQLLAEALQALATQPVAELAAH